MPFFDPIRIGASGSVAADFTVDRSLRFNDDDSAYLARTPSSASNRKTWTYSFWFKISTPAGQQVFFSVNGNSNSTYLDVTYKQDETISMQLYTNSLLKTNRKFKDPSAWYHIVVAFDSTQATGTNRLKLYVNGIEETSFSSDNRASLITQDGDFAMNSTGQLAIGRDNLNNNKYFDGYMAEINHIDGQQLTPSSFAETDAVTGQWNPINTSGLTFGTNGFRLQFADNSGTTATTLGKDTSGNSNNFTPNNLAVSDAVKDSPTNNFCTFNPLSNYDNSTLSEGNLKVTGTGSDHSWQQVRGNMGVSSGKWYFEIRCNSISANEGWIAGIHQVFGRDTEGYFWYSGGYTAAGYGYAYGVQDNNQRRTNGGSDDAFSSDVTAGKVVGFRLNLDDNEILISVDGVDKGKMYDIQSGITYSPAVNIYTTSSATLNCGQDSTFQGQESSGGNTDSGGIGDFAYAVPSGYKALCSANLPDPTILLPNQHFNTLLYTGNGSTQSISGLNFQPDWVWIKQRNAAENHFLTDSNRGAGLHLRSDQGTAESDDSATFTAFTSDGFSLTGTGSAAAQVNDNSDTYVAWNWNAGETDGKTYTVTVVDDSGNKFRFDGYGTSAVTLDLAEGGTYIFNYPSGHPFRFSTTADGTHGGGSEYTTGVTHNSSTQVTIVVAASAPTLYYYCSSHSGMGGQVNTNSTLGSSNFDGNLQSTAKVNATAGFSIVKWTSGANVYKTVGHGLGVKPDIVILKSRTTVHAWFVYTDVIDGTNDYLELNEETAQQNAEAYSIVPPTSTVFGTDGAFIGGNTNIPMIAYVFSSVSSYSKFGKYTGNGSSDGTFVFTGFRPAWVMVKRTNQAAAWCVMDNKRAGYNSDNDYLQPDNNLAESDGSSGTLDILSNGFKMTTTAGTFNNSGGTFIYLAFASSPFKNARAR